MPAQPRLFWLLGKLSNTSWGERGCCQRGFCWLRTITTLRTQKTFHVKFRELMVCTMRGKLHYGFTITHAIMVQRMDPEPGIGVRTVLPESSLMKDLVRLSINTSINSFFQVLMPISMETFKEPTLSCVHQGNISSQIKDKSLDSGLRT